MSEITGKHVLLKDKEGNYLFPETMKTNVIAVDNVYVPTSDAVSKAISAAASEKADISHTHTKAQVTGLPSVVPSLPNYSSGSSVSTSKTWTSTGNGWLSIIVSGDGAWVTYKVNSKIIGKHGTSHDNNSCMFIPISTGDKVAVESSTTLTVSMTFFPFK